MDKDDTGDVADRRRRPPKYGPWNWLPVCLFIVFSVGGAWNSDSIGVTPMFEYRLGTPAIATVESCAENTFPPARSCSASWTVAGVSHAGVISGPVKGIPVGSRVDVHVRGETAYLAYWAFPMWNFIFAGIFALTAFAFFAVLRKQKTGRWPWAGWLAR